MDYGKGRDGMDRSSPEFRSFSKGKDGGKGFDNSNFEDDDGPFGKGKMNFSRGKGEEEFGRGKGSGNFLFGSENRILGKGGDEENEST